MSEANTKITELRKTKMPVSKIGSLTGDFYNQLAKGKVGKVNSIDPGVAFTDQYKIAILFCPVGVAKDGRGGFIIGHNIPEDF